MQIAQMNWSDVAACAARDPRVVLPLGSTEQHAQLSLCVDAILAERNAVQAAEPLGIPVYPVMPFGLAPYFIAYPGTISLRVETLLAVMRDVVASVRRSGFRQILIVNGHGGNAPVGALAQELMADHPDFSVKFHNWWSAPATWAAVEAVGGGSHANWMENFPWTRLPHAPAPDGTKTAVDLDIVRNSPPALVRQALGDGSFGDRWQIDDATMQAIWDTGVMETRAALTGPWPQD
jgi:creatinine amidohydrolase